MREGALERAQGLTLFDKLFIGVFVGLVVSIGLRCLASHKIVFALYLFKKMKWEMVKVCLIIPWAEQVAFHKVILEFLRSIIKNSRVVVGLIIIGYAIFHMNLYYAEDFFPGQGLVGKLVASSLLSIVLQGLSFITGDLKGAVVAAMTVNICYFLLGF